MDDHPKERRIEENVLAYIQLFIPSKRLHEALLSVPSWSKIAGGNGFVRHGPGGVSARVRTYDYPDCCPTYEEHAERIPLAEKQVLLMLGTRNLGNNLCFVAYHEGRQPKVLHLADEPYDRRPYACLCWAEVDGHMCLSLEKVMFPD